MRIHECILDDEPLLSASTSTLSTELLGLHPPRVCDEQRPIIRNQFFLELNRGIRVHVFCVISYHGLGDGLADCVHLRCVSTTLNTDSNVDTGERFFTSHENCLINFESEKFRFEEVDRGSIDTEQAFALASVRNGRCGLI